MLPPEPELLERYKSGDSQAFRDLVQRFKGPLTRYLAALVGDPDRAVDLAQETFLRVYSRAATFRLDGSFQRWIYKIATNVARNDLRWWRRRPAARCLSGAETETPDPEPASRPDLLMLQAERVRRVRRAVASLPFKLRTALALRDLEGLSYQEIALVTRLPLGTVKSQVQRARLLLRRKLESL
jgi:RNA polymerase sigma-70 factor (ECF subfamily)